MCCSQAVSAKDNEAVSANTGPLKLMEFRTVSLQASAPPNAKTGNSGELFIGRKAFTKSERSRIH